MIKPIKKARKIIIFLVVFLFFIFILSRGHVYDKDELEYGITFSKKQAEFLGLDWKNVYVSMFDDLGIKKIRIPAYWDVVEGNRGKFWWDDLDWQIDEAQKRDVDIILSVGSRLPRWPECHYPDWAGKLEQKEREDETLEYIKETVLRYKKYNKIIAWQVENEPFLSHFGKCPKLNKSFLDKEIESVKNLDSRPIVITDSGELSFWVPAAKRADIFGITMYRDTYSQTLKRYIHYPIGPAFFRFKKNIANIFASPDKWIVIELQGEPWGSEAYQNLTQEEREITMSLQKFREMIKFARQTGFREFYLWGVEWWYWEDQYNNNPKFLEEAKNLFN